MDSAIGALGGLDVLVNNPSGFGRTDDEEGWRVGLDVDLMALVRASWKAVDAMQAARRRGDRAYFVDIRPYVINAHAAIWCGEGGCDSVHADPSSPVGLRWYPRELHRPGLH